MSTRDDLKNRIGQAHALSQRNGRMFQPGYIADVLLVDGWRPPMRVIETVEELEALPVGAVIFNRNGESLQIQDNYGKEFYYAAADETPYGAHFLFEVGDGPFRVVWEPEVDK